jgi:hypothetical protein
LISFTSLLLATTPQPSGWERKPNLAESDTTWKWACVVAEPTIGGSLVQLLVRSRVVTNPVQDLTPPKSTGWVLG